MRIDQSYTFSAFGNFAEIKPEPDAMAFFLDSFKDRQLMPSIVQEWEWNVPVGSPDVKQRLSLISPDNQTRVMIGSQRLDYGIFPDDEIKMDDKWTKERNQEICEAFNLIFKRFPVKATRLALNTGSVLLLTAQETHDFLTRFSNPLPFYQRDLAEWSARLNVREEASICGVSETCNIISTISKSDLQKVKEKEIIERDGFLVNLDINTIPQKTSERFGAGKTWEDFLTQAVQWRETVLNEIR